MARLGDIKISGVTNIELFTTLEVDAMYYHTARRALSEAQTQNEALEGPVTKHARLLETAQQIKAKHAESNTDGYDELEPIYIALESAETELGLAYGPLLQNLAAVHLFSAASLEAHINWRAKDTLSRRSLDEFDKLSIAGKWLFLPKFAGAKGFDPGSQPFQTFDQLVGYRNSLMHYKVRREKRQSRGIPEFLIKLGLDLVLAEQSLKIVPAMIKQLSHELNTKAPDWLEADRASYFGLEIKFA